MKILADESILAVEHGFQQFGELRLFSGRTIGPADLLDADILLLRSVTTVDESLLRDSNIKFVGTATSGSNHIDLAYLQANGIAFADARGSNANAVVDYCFSALAYMALQGHLDLENCRLGILGGGNVGGLLARKLDHLGIAYRLCDPPLQQAKSEGEGSVQYCSLEEVLQCDVISLHVPLISDGDHPTKNLLNESNLGLLPEGAILINACRGGVVDEQALTDFLRVRKDVRCVFDVWQAEPSVDLRLLETIELATPHIAGYSQQAKLAATAQLVQALQQFLGEPVSDYKDATVDITAIELPATGGEMAHCSLVLNALPLDKLSAQFKQSVAVGEVRKAFDGFRRRLLSRQEFNSMSVQAGALSPSQRHFLSTLGFLCK